MKNGICSICNENRKLTARGKIYNHGYKREIRYRKWTGYLSMTFIKAYYILTKPPCIGSGLYPTSLSDDKGL